MYKVMIGKRVYSLTAKELVKINKPVTFIL